MLTELVNELGFSEDEPLTQAHTGVLAAISSADRAEYEQAWQQYHSVADSHCTRLLNAGDTGDRFQLGLLLARAAIWGEAGDQVRYFEALSSALLVAIQSHNDDIIVRIKRLLFHDDDPRALTPEYHQAIDRHEEAITGYLKRKQLRSLTHRERGLVNLRLAECYWALLQENRDQPDLKALLDGSLASALGYLGGSPEQAWALRLLDAIAAEPGH